MNRRCARAVNVVSLFLCLLQQQKTERRAAMPTWEQVCALAEDRALIVSHFETHPGKALVSMDGGDLVACSRENITSFPSSADRNLLLEQMSKADETKHVVVAKYSTSEGGRFASATVEVRPRGA